MEATLEVSAGPVQRETFRVTRDATIGRASDCDICLPNNDVSRRHCAIEALDGQFVIRDLNSANGTLVNGRPVTDAVPLGDGDTITVGCITLVFWYASTAEARALDKTIIGRAEVSPDAAPFNFVAASSDPEQLRNALNKLRVIYRTNQFLSRIVREDELFPRILEQLFEVLAVDHGVILLGEDPDLMEVAAERKRTSLIAGKRPSRTVVRRVYSSKEALLILDVQGDNRFSDARSLVDSSLRSLMCAPLAYGDQIFGVVQCSSQSRASAFKQADLEVMAAIASQTAIALGNIRLVKRLQIEAEVRANLARFLPRELVNEAVEKRVPMEVGGRKCKIVVLFADLRGFTAMAESLDPAELVQTMNEFFSKMVDAVFSHGGTLDKFIGDAVMAFWGAPVHNSDDGLRAVRCALDMQSIIRRLNAARRARGLTPLEVGIGLHCGEAVVGNVGSDKRMEYTALGSTVNISSRIQGASKGGEVLISEHLFAELRGTAVGKWQDSVQLRGLRAPMRLFSVTGLIGYVTSVDREIEVAPDDTATALDAME